MHDAGPEVLERLARLDQACECLRLLLGEVRTRCGFGELGQSLREADLARVGPEVKPVEAMFHGNFEAREFVDEGAPQVYETVRLALRQEY
jgi:hypothetical protein